MEPPPRRDADMEELIRDLEHAAKIPAKQRALNISTKVDRLCSKLFDDGLSDASLERLVDLIALPNELDQASVSNLVKNLYPAAKVSSQIVVKIVGCLGHGRAKPAYSSQAAFLKWLVMVYHVLEAPKILSQLYPVLFNLLDTSIIRASLCHVLSLVTRRRHVRPYRIQQLMELTRQSGNEPQLVGLMRVFKDYYPDVIVGDVIAGRASVFTHPNPEWSQHLDEIQAAHLQRTQEQQPQHHQSFRVTRTRNRSSRQTKSSVIPEVHTFSANESSVTLEEIEDVHDFVRRLEKIEPPNQLVAVIRDPLLQKFMQLRSSEAYQKRVDRWLLAFFEDQLQAVAPSEAKILGMLNGILEYTRYTKALPPSCFAYLTSMIPTWDGIVGREVILDLLTYSPIIPFPDLQAQVFQAMEEAVLEDGSAESKLTILKFYSSLITNWTVSLESSSQPPPAAAAAITSLVTHANALSMVLIHDSPTVSTLSAVLSFYENIGTLISLHSIINTIRIPLPPPELTYLLLFTSSLNTLSRLCGLLSAYKTAFENARQKNSHQHPPSLVNTFNGYLMHVCNCISTSRAFSGKDPASRPCLQEPDTVAYLEAYVKSLERPPLTLSALFSLSFSPVLCLISISYLRELEDAKESEITTRHAGPVTMASLKQLEREGGVDVSWPTYRLGVLMYLERRGVKGAGNLMYNTMKVVRSAREGMVL
ncbi:Mis6-domain-containing protein [Amylocarpus encephaloides]|uniref:Mis6-domain-containing protein n=1 Tax=Amylocarpus encephaloides TaxID=45428 RepID=A0A9P8C7R0_9HELO|nr:Mis6-domain-containing protein [Amylocarpus encephaloides]